MRRPVSSRSTARDCARGPPAGPRRRPPAEWCRRERAAGGGAGRWGARGRRDCPPQVPGSHMLLRAWAPLRRPRRAVRTARWSGQSTAGGRELCQRPGCGGGAVVAGGGDWERLAPQPRPVTHGQRALPFVARATPRASPAQSASAPGAASWPSSRALQHGKDRGGESLGGTAGEQLFWSRV